MEESDTEQDQAKDLAKRGLGKTCHPALFCDNCGHYPIKPMHGHYVCPACHMPTKCCEGAPLDE